MGKFDKLLGKYREDDAEGIDLSGYMELQPDGNVVWNEDGLDVDLRFEGDTEPNLLVLDAGSNRVSVGGPVSNLNGEFTSKNRVDIVRHEASTQPAIMIMYKRGTTGDADAATTNGNTIANLQVYGFNGIGPNKGAEFLFNATQTWSGTGRGCAFRLLLTPNNSTSQFNALILNQDGALSLGGTNGRISTATNVNLQLLPGGTGITQVGDASTTSHSLNTNDDLYVSGRLEVDGNTYFDGSIGFFNTTPAAQQNTTGTTTGFTAGAGTSANDDSTFTGNTGSTAYTVGDIVRALKNYGLLAA